MEITDRGKEKTISHPFLCRNLTSISNSLHFSRVKG